MNKLNSLEKDVLLAFLSSILYGSSEVEMALKELEVKSRSFSSLDGRTCSGFYTHFRENKLLSSIKDVPHNFSIQAKYEELSSGEMGFIIFCNEIEKSINTLEGFFYGNDMLPIENITKSEHNFSVYLIE
jgi:hypothetical protein